VNGLVSHELKRGFPVGYTDLDASETPLYPK